MNRGVQKNFPARNFSRRNFYGRKILPPRIFRDGFFGKFFAVNSEKIPARANCLYKMFHVEHFESDPCSDCDCSFFSRSRFMKNFCSVLMPALFAVNFSRRNFFTAQNFLLRKFMARKFFCRARFSVERKNFPKKDCRRFPSEAWKSAAIFLRHDFLSLFCHSVLA